MVNILTAFRDIPQNGIAISHEMHFYAIAQRIWKQHQHVYHILSSHLYIMFPFSCAKKSFDHLSSTTECFEQPHGPHHFEAYLDSSQAAYHFKKSLHTSMESSIRNQSCRFQVSFLYGKKDPRFRFRVRLWTHVCTYVYENKYMYINTYTNMYVIM